MQVSWALVHGNQDRLEDLLPACLSAQELERYRAFRFPKRKQEWLLGRWTAKHLVLASQQPMDGVTAQQVEIWNDPNGAPFITLAGRRFSGGISISHRDGSAFCALSAPRIAIGADLEIVEARQPGFLADYFTPDEQAWVAACPLADRDEKTALIWSAKEAVLKVLGTGLRIDTWEIEISAGGTNMAQTDGTQWQSIFARSRHLPDGGQTLYFLRTGDFIQMLMTLPQVSPTGWQQFNLTLPR